MELIENGTKLKIGDKTWTLIDEDEKVGIYKVKEKLISKIYTLIPDIDDPYQLETMAETLLTLSKF